MSQTMYCQTLNKAIENCMLFSRTNNTVILFFMALMIFFTLATILGVDEYWQNRISQNNQNQTNNLLGAGGEL